MITRIPFDRELGGYNRTQVDNYVTLLSEAYDEAFKEYEEACRKYNRLLDRIYGGLEPKTTDSGRPRESPPAESHEVPNNQITGGKTFVPPAESFALPVGQMEGGGVFAGRRTATTKTVEDYYKEAMLLDSRVDSLALR